jgi:hypothetical protein
MSVSVTVAFSGGSNPNRESSIPGSNETFR